MRTQASCRNCSYDFKINYLKNCIMDAKIKQLNYNCRQETEFN